MLPRPLRLSKRNDILHTIRYGKVYMTPYVRIYVHPTNRTKHSRVACIVGRRIHTSSVVRHRYQRLLREAARSILTSLNHPYDMAWVAKPKILSVKNVQELKKDLQSVIERLKKANSEQTYIV